MNEPAWWGWEAGARSTRSRPIDHGLVLDYGEDDQLIGIEITSPVNATFTDRSPGSQGRDRSSVLERRGSRCAVERSLPAHSGDWSRASAHALLSSGDIHIASGDEGGLISSFNHQYVPIRALRNATQPILSTILKDERHGVL